MEFLQLFVKLPEEMERLKRASFLVLLAAGEETHCVCNQFQYTAFYEISLLTGIFEILTFFFQETEGKAVLNLVSQLILEATEVKCEMTQILPHRKFSVMVGVHFCLALSFLGAEYSPPASEQKPLLQ